MCGVVQDLLDELVAEERALAEQSLAEERNKTQALALEMFAQGTSVEKIAALMHEDVEAVQAWLAKAKRVS